MEEEYDLKLAEKELKELGVWTAADRCPIGTTLAPRACEVVEVKVENGMKLKRWQPMFVLAAQVFPKPLPPMSEELKLRYKKHVARISGVAAKKKVLDDVFAENSPFASLDNEQVLKRYENLKKFDIVEDHSDHLFSAQSAAAMQSEDWANKIRQEWRILKEGLPETIFVRVYESRMDILRAVLTGLEGTPYHDGLFFFDVCFPSNYPNTPPLVRYNSGVSGINPHMDKCGGEVRLFFPGTEEKIWVPGTSNLLQLLVSIQGLFLNSKPFFNISPLETWRGNLGAERRALIYNENVVMRSLKTMVYTMNKPPKNFEDLVVGHFRLRVHDILKACIAYKDDLQSRCLVSGDGHSSSMKFKKDVASCIKPLVSAFNKIGVKEAQDYLHLITANAPTPVDGGAINDAAENKKRKADEDIDGAVTKKCKDIDDVCPPRLHVFTIYAPTDYVISKVMVKEGEKIKKGQPLCVMARRTRQEQLMDFNNRNQLKDDKSKIKRILTDNWRAGVGIFSMEEGVFVDAAAAAEKDTPMAMAMAGLDVMERYEKFNKFGIVEEYSDHFFAAQDYAMDQPSEEWANKIREEWKILEEQLTESSTIFVRVYQNRMDLLRAVIIGPDGTPYHDGLFFFDVCFPSNYPNSPPLVHYHSGGLGINPNLYKSGEVELSLPKTDGNGNGGREMLWVAGTSTMLQLLVSIQNQILNKKPLFNDQTYAAAAMRGGGCSYGAISSMLYNKNTLVKSLKTMVYTMNKPPKNFEDFVAGHFRNRVGDIMKTCNKKTGFKKYLASCIKPLVAAFNKIGAECPPPPPS